MINKEINPDNDIYDLTEEYYKKRSENSELDEEGEDYFPVEESKPPHY